MNQYPVFQEGQTLTAVELNQLRDFLHDRDRLLGRLIGFGINCGLEGAIQGATLQIEPGLAIDQTGEPLVLSAAATIALPPAASGTFEFVETAPGGFTVVLVAGDTEEPVPDCGDDGCAGHAEQHTRAVELKVVSGRLNGSFFDFSGEPLLSQTPLRLSKTSNPSGSFVTLRDAVHARIGAKLDPAIASKLRNLSIATSDLPSIKAFKAAFLNQVYFAALDLLRCEGLMDIVCDRPTTTPGVALGWLHQVAATWVWECDWRHHWEPPTGFSMAMIGGSCDDPCRPYVDRLEGLIDTFEVPVVPAPPDPPRGGGIDPGDYHFCPPHKGIWDFDCPILVYPPVELPPRWGDIIVGGGKKFPPDPGYIDPIRPDMIYEVDELDWLDTGTIGLGPAWGAEVFGVKGALETLIGQQGIEPNVVVVEQKDLAGLDGYQPTGAISLADTVVLTKDAQGKVIGTGRVPGTKAVRNVGTQLPKATEAANTAIAATTRMEGELGTFGAQMEGLVGDVGALQTFRVEIQQWRSTTDGVLGGMSGMIQNEVQSHYGAQLGGVMERMSRLEGGVEANRKIVENSTLRLDQVFTGKLAGGEADFREFNRGMLDVFSVMRSSIAAAAGPDRLPKVTEALRRGDEALATLEAAAGVVVLTQQKEALGVVFDSLGAALEVSGVSAGQMRQIQKGIEALKESMP